MAKNTTVKAVETVEKFDFTKVEAEATKMRGIPCAELLNSTASSMATNLVKSLQGNEELIQAANKMTDSGEFGDLIALIKAVYSDEELKLKELSTCDEAELARLLESRRSDRSKAKKLGFSTVQAVLRYVGAGIAELIVRDAMGKEYSNISVSARSYSVEELANNQDALNKKIRSLQSKISNIRREGRYAPATWYGWPRIAELQEEIAELQAHRVSNGTRRTTTVKAPSLEQIKSAIDTMSEEERLALIAQLQNA